MIVFAFTVGLFFCLSHHLHAVGSQLAAPDNLTMVTLNTNYTLRWDWDQTWSQDVTFTAEYVPEFLVKHSRKKVEWNVECADTSRQSCDFSGASLYYWGIYLFRVQANASGTLSQSEYLRFHPDEHAKVGPPSRVALSHAEKDVDIYIDDPMTNTNTSMRKCLPKLFYHILYWEGPSLSQSSSVHNLTSKANLVTVSDLKASTLYCVAVQTRNKYYWKESSFTSPLCIWTEGVTAWWMITLCFLGSMVVCFIIVLFFYKTYRSVKGVFFSTSQLPSHFKEYLCDSPGCDMPRLLDSHSELLCDKVVVCPQSFPQAVTAPPSGWEAYSSCHGGPQGSRSSRDSGVYSSDSGCSASQPSSQNTSGASDVCWTDLCNQDQLKMEVEAAGGQVGDEGVSDVAI